jgi:hypothetical protein
MVDTFLRSDMTLYAAACTVIVHSLPLALRSSCTVSLHHPDIRAIPPRRYPGMALTLVNIAPLPMQLLRQLLIRMRLHTQRLANAQHLEQERQVSITRGGVPFEHFWGEVSFWVGGEEGGEFGGVDVGGEGVVCAHPELYRVSDIVK